MRTGAGIIALLLGGALLPAGLRAQENTEPEAKGRAAPVEGLRAVADGPVAAKLRTPMQLQLSQVIRAEAGMAGAAPTMVADGPAAGAEEALQLEPMVVEGEKVRELAPVLRENKVQEILRTGTLWEKKGPRFTRRFWIKGDRGIGFTLAW